MNSELDQADIPRGSDEEFEQFLDDLYLAQEDERAAFHQMAQTEYDEICKRIGDF